MSEDNTHVFGVAESNGRYVVQCHVWQADS